MHKMMSSSKGKDFQAKQEDNNDNDKIEKGKMATTRSSWSGLKDPRVVRVSRTFGGKDRHSKVCTVRGLRDRRVRLSVPTAIQLYDLQDRLGLNQPSKVVDWLLNAAKDDIDELPPLQIPPGIFGQYSQSMVVTQGVNDQMQSCFSPLVDSYMKSDSSHLLQSNKEGFTINDNIDSEDQTSEQPKSRYWNLNSAPLIISKSKEASHETATDQRTNWMSPKRSNMEQGISQEDGNVQNAKVVSSHFLIPRITTNLSSLPSLQDSVIPQNSFGHWDPSNLSLSNLGSTTQSGYSSSQTEDPSSSPSRLSLPSSTSQYLVYPSGTTPTFFQPYATTHQHPLDSNPIRQLNYFHMMSSTAGLQTLPVNNITPSPYPNSSGNPIMRPFHMGVISDPSKLLHPQNNNGSQPNKGSNTSSTSFT